MSRLRCTGDGTDGPELRAGEEFGDGNDQDGDHDADDGAPEQVEHRVVEVAEVSAVVEQHGDQQEARERDDGGDDEPSVQRAHDPCTSPHPHEERSDDRGDDAHRAEHQRVEHEHQVRLAADLVQQAAEQHRRHRRDRVRLEKVRCHTGAIADVVTDVVGDDRRVAWVVLGNARLELPDQVGADVGSFGVDAAAETCKDRDQRCAECKADERVEVLEDPVGESHPDQSESDDEEARHGTASERDLESGVDAASSRFSGSQVGAHRDVHPDVPGGAAEDGADQEEDAGLPPERERQEDEDDRADPGDDRVLAVEVRGRALLDRFGDLLHLVVAFRLTEHPEDQEDGKEKGEEPSCADRQ